MSATDTRNHIIEKFSSAFQGGIKEVKLVSGDIHRELKYETNQHQAVCSVMYSMPKYYDCKITCTNGPPSGFGARLEVTYRLNSDKRFEKTSGTALRFCSDADRADPSLCGIIQKTSGKMSAISSGKPDDSCGLEKLKEILDGKIILFVLPCCDSKCPGGQTLTFPSRGILDLLSNEDRQSILDGRKCVLKNETTQGVDAVGYEFGNGHSVAALYLPAYNRYKGILYNVDGVKPILEKPAPNQLCIISALYGVIMSEDQIQDYNLVMQGQVEQVWKDKIPIILDSLAAKTRVQVIVGLFGKTTGYAKCFAKLAARPKGLPVYHVYSTQTGRHPVLKALGNALVYLGGRSQEVPTECRVRAIRGG